MSDGGNGQMREENCNAACKTCIIRKYSNTESTLAVQLQAQRHITGKGRMGEHVTQFLGGTTRRVRLDPLVLEVTSSLARTLVF